MRVHRSRSQRWRWPGPSKRRLAAIVGTAVVGLGLVVGARFVDDDWWTSVMIEIGASVVLVAPVLWLENALRQKLNEIDAALRSSATGLSAVRELLPYGARRTAVFDELLEGVRERAADGEFPPAQLATLLRGDSDDRTVALAAMVGAPSLIDSAAILRSIRRSESGNEQYYALCAARAGWADDLTSVDRTEILDAIERDDRDRQWISESRSRTAIAEELRGTTGPVASGES